MNDIHNEAGHEDDDAGALTLDDLIGHLDDEEETAKQYQTRSFECQRPSHQAISFVSPTSHFHQNQAKRSRTTLSMPTSSSRFLRPLKRGSDYTEADILGIPVDRQVDEDFVSNRLCCKLQDLISLERYQIEDLAKQDDFFTICVLSSKGITKTSAKTKLPYRIWTISNLHCQESKLFLFGQAYQKYSTSVAEGTVLALVSPKVQLPQPSEDDDRDPELSISISRQEQLVVLGACATFSKCKNSNCRFGCNRAISVFCTKHASEQLKILKVNRMDLNSNGGGGSRAGMDNPSKAPFSERDAKLARQGRFPGVGDIGRRHPPTRVPLAAIASLNGGLEAIDKPKQTAREKMEKTIHQATKGCLSAGQKKVALALKLLASSDVTIGGAGQREARVGYTPAPSSSSSSSAAAPALAPAPKRPVQLGSGLAAASMSLQEKQKLQMKTLMMPGALASRALPAKDKPKSGLNKDFKVPNYSAMMNAEDKAKLANRSKGPNKFLEAFAGVKE